ncbi:hypothetical protein [Phenylobacterium sp.]|uniref:hypothetical protein n=1 Tax=Phenylobacterium sp. TaxID=1871053 RepID=UPI00289D802B|nr:hypothetical protein [Phenylobacterium sp.]
MGDRRRTRLYVLLGVSGLAHVAALGVLALQHPELRQASAPPVMDVQIAPYYVPPRAERALGRQPPLVERPIRPRRTLRPDETATIAPLVTPNAPAPPEGPWAVSPPAAGVPAPPSSDLRQALRRGTVGCGAPDLLSREEREACQERLGAGAKDAPFIAPPIAADKRQEFDRAAARNRAKWRERESPMPAPVPSGPSSPSQAPNPFPEVWTPRP